MPARWLMDLFDAISGNRGYLAVGSVLAAYLAAFGLIDTKSTQEETRASVERSLFITLVSTGSAASFVAAMKDFGLIQTLPATEHPSLLKFWEWGRTYQPNRDPMWHWAGWRLGLCSKESKDCSPRSDWRLDLAAANLVDANLDYADLGGAYLRNAYLRRADLRHADLRGADAVRADLRGADLRYANLSDIDLTSADLRGADLRHADLASAGLIGAALSSVRYSAETIFPPDFDPKARKMVPITDSP
jgi:hypothetical protein